MSNTGVVKNAALLSDLDALGEASSLVPSSSEEHSTYEVPEHGGSRLEEKRKADLAKVQAILDAASVPDIEAVVTATGQEDDRGDDTREARRKAREASWAQKKKDRQGED